MSITSRNYPISIYNSSLTKVAEIDDYIHFSWKRRWRRPDEWVMHVNRYATGVDKITTDSIIVFPRGNENRAGVIDFMSLALTEEGKLSENWELRGSAYSGIFQHRIAYTSANTGTGYDVQTGAGETVMRYYVDAECISVDNPDRVVPNLVLAADQARGVSVTYSARLQDLAKILEEICFYTGLGYEVEVDLNENEFVFTVYQGKDLSPTNTEGNSPVTFTPEFGNVKLLNYRYSRMDSKNLAIGCGQGEGASRLIVPVYKDINARLEHTEDYSTGIHASTIETAEGNLELEQAGTLNENTFGADTVGNAPANFTNRWNADHTFLAQSEAGATDGKVLEHIANTNARRMISWDTPGTPENLIIETKCKANGITFNRCRLHVRSGGAVGVEEGYFVELYDGQYFRLWRYYSGSNGTLSTYGYSWSADTYYRMKLQIIRDRIQAKVWEDGEDEPTDWQIDVTDELIGTGGWVGIGTYTNGTCTYDWIKVQEVEYVSGDYESAAIDYSTARIVREHKIEWTEDAPAGTSVTVEHSIDAGATWSACTSGSPLPGISIGDDLDGVSGKVRVSLDPGSTPYTPTVSPFAITINGRTTTTGMSGYDVREFVIDARDLTTSDEVIQRCNERLNELGVDEIVVLENLPGSREQYIQSYAASSQSFRQHPATWISSSEENEGVAETAGGHLTLTALTGYDILTPHEITKVELGTGSTVTWDETKPAGTDIKVYFGLSDDSTTQPPAWYEVTNGGSIDFITGNYAIKGKYLWPKVYLETTDAGTLPEMIRLYVTVNGLNAVWDIREGTFTYLTDYKCGDIVQANYPGIVEMDARIIEVDEVYDEKGESHRIILGREVPDLKGQIRGLFRNTDPELRR